MLDLASETELFSVLASAMPSKYKIILHNGEDAHVYNAESYRIDGTVVHFETRNEIVVSSLPFEVIREK